MPRLRSNQTTAPAEDPVSVAELRAHLRITATGEDTYLGTLITAATRAVENRANRQLVTATWTHTLDAFPACRAFELPRAPLASITGITYTDTDGATQTLSTDVYAADATGLVGRVLLKYAQSWPADVRPDYNAVSIVAVHGYGAASAVPANAKHAVKLLCGHWYENRENVSVGAGASEIPDTVRMLIDTFAVPEVY